MKADKDSNRGSLATTSNSSIKIESILFIFVRIRIYGRRMVFVVVVSSFLIFSILSLSCPISRLSKTMLKNKGGGKCPYFIPT